MAIYGLEIQCGHRKRYEGTSDSSMQSHPMPISQVSVLRKFFSSAYISTHCRFNEVGNDVVWQIVPNFRQESFWSEPRPSEGVK
jgi:hypothetical protein